MIRSISCRNIIIINIIIIIIFIFIFISSTTILNINNISVISIISILTREYILITSIFIYFVVDLSLDMSN